MDSEDCSIIEEKVPRIHDEKSLVEAVWKDKTGKSTKLLANYIRYWKNQTNILPAMILKEISHDDSQKFTNKNANLEEILDLLLVATPFDDHFTAEFLSEIKEFPTNLDAVKLQNLFDKLWYQAAKEKCSCHLMNQLIRLNFEEIRQKLDKIAVESDNEGWDLIRFIDGYSQIYEISINDSSGEFFMEVLKYFIGKAEAKEFCRTVIEEIGGILISDVKYKLGDEKFYQLLSKNVQFYIKLLNVSTRDCVEKLLQEILKKSLEEFLTITIVLSQYSYLIEKMYH